MKKLFSRYFFQLILGLSLVSGVTFAAVNDHLKLPPLGEVGDIITSDNWNKIIDALNILDERTQEVQTDTATGNTAIGEVADNPAVKPVEKLDVRGAIKIGTTTTENSGTIRYTGDDFEGYTGDDWKSLTKGGDGSGSAGSCEAISSGDDFTKDIATASCTTGSISYSAVEWESQQGKFFPSFAISTNPSNTAASLNCLGNGCKVQLICCAGGAGSGGANDVVAKLNCSDKETISWDGNLSKWKCSTLDLVNEWTEKDGDIYREVGNLGIGTNEPKAKLDINVGDKYDGVRVSSSTQARLILNNTGSNKEWIMYANNGAGDLNFWDGSKDTITLKQGGNVGIGTTTPSAKLDVAGSIRFAPQSSAPYSCDAEHKGSVYFDETQDMIFVCKSNGWTEFRGPAGTNGSQGVKGDKGDKGDTGPQGPAGPAAPVKGSGGVCGNYNYITPAGGGPSWTVSGINGVTYKSSTGSSIDCSFIPDCQGSNVRLRTAGGSNYSAGLCLK